jgi:zinc transport system substrate-binding protein
VRFARIVDRIESALSEPTAAGRLRADLEDLDARYRQGLGDCRSRTMVVSHEAFGYLADRYGLEQVGLAGVEPEGEPTADALREAAEVLATAGGGAVFYEAGDEARRIAETVASDAGVPALPLSTLESAPPAGDYLSVMEENLESLRRGLGCA